MNKFFLKISTGGKSYNAGYKAVADLYKVMEREGYSPIECKLQTGKSKITKFIHLIKDVFSAIKAMGKDSTIIYIYPDILYYDFLFALLRIKPHHKIAIILDINSLREGNGEISSRDKNNLLKYDMLIVHTPAMKKYLIDNGFRDERLKIIEMFDYLVDFPNKIERKNGDTVCYAGNLNKSDFLIEIPNKNIKGIKFNLYGAESKNVPFGENIIYKGKFEPGNLSDLQANWGLVWDGNSADTCSGAYGRYLKVNIPHKTCLYAAAQLPIIIWEEAAMAKFIKEQEIGITVKSLEDIPQKISEITQEEYAVMFSNLKKLSQKLNKGEMLSNCVKS